MLCSRIDKMKKTIMLTDSDKDIKTASELIRSGEVVGIPTETVYGLGADALNADAVKKIFAAKGRPADNPLIVHIYNLEQSERLAVNIPELFFKLAEKFWPGPLTMIVPKNKIIPDETSGGLDTVGIRMPSHRVMRELIRLSFPIAAPSANRSGYPSPTSAEHVMQDMNGKISAVIDGGISRFGVESTVISFDNADTVRILRPGSVTERELSEVAENVIIDDAILNDIANDRAAPSPGMKYKHYSPEADVKIIEGSFDEFAGYADSLKKDGLYCLIFDNDDKSKLPCSFMTYGNDSDTQAHSLFSRLRELDKAGAKEILVRSPQKDGVGLAVYNRLLRAAGFEVIKL